MRIDLSRGRVDVDLARDPGECVFEVLRGDPDDPDRTWFDAGGELLRGVTTAIVGTDLTRVEYRLNRKTLPVRQATRMHMWMGSAESVCLEDRPDVHRGMVRSRSILGVTWNLTTPNYEAQGRWALELVSTFDDQMPAGAVLRFWLDGFEPGLVFTEPDVPERYVREEVL